MHDAEFPPSLFETYTFRTLCVTVRDAVEANKTPACTRDIKKRAKLTAAQERLLLDALSSLETVGAVRVVRELPVRRWVTSEAPPPPPAKVKRNWQLTPAKTKRPDSFEYREARA